MFKKLVIAGLLLTGFLPAKTTDQTLHKLERIFKYCNGFQYIASVGHNSNFTTNWAKIIIYKRTRNLEFRFTEDELVSVAKSENDMVSGIAEILISAILLNKKPKFKYSAPGI